MWLPLALRNLLRNRRRTFLTLAVIALGTTMSFVVGGMIANALDTLQASAVAQYGNLQIGSSLLWEDDNQGEETLIMPETLAEIEGILAGQAEVSAWTPQLLLSGLASTNTNAKVLEVLGFVPGNDALDYNDLLVTGDPLSEGQRNPALIGGSLAKEFNLQQGDVLKITTNTIGGAFNQEALRISGVYFRNDVQDESQLIFVPLSTGQKIIKTDGISKVAVTLHSLEATDAVAVTLQQSLEAAGLDYEVRTWEQLSVVYQQTRGFFDLMFGFLMVSITLLVFFIVFQVLSMSFFERTREVGTIRAIGTKRHQVFTLFILESAAIGIIGGGMGLAIGWLLAVGLNSLSFSWTPPGALQPFPIQAVLSWQNAWLPLVVAALATLLSALYPSFHSARLSIVDALRTH